MHSAETKNTVLVNGEITADISVHDRGLQYGHGLFETIAIKDGELKYWDQHMARLIDGCARLLIKSPDISLLLKEALVLMADVEGKAVLKIIYTSGGEGRGYKSPEKMTPNRILSCSDWPNYPEENFQSGVTVRLCETRLGINSSLAGIKHLNRLEQVLARSEWSDPDIAEGLMLDQQGLLKEATMSNVFFVKDNTLCTPDLTQSGVAGIMRKVVLDQAENLAIRTYIDDFTPADIFQADEVFLTNSLIEIWPIKKILSEETINLTQPKTITTKLINKIREA